VKSVAVTVVQQFMGSTAVAYVTDQSHPTGSESYGSNDEARSNQKNGKSGHRHYCNTTAT
jgi:hypothetical protein